MAVSHSMAPKPPYPSPRNCIYCGLTDVKSEEHIVPFVLNGSWVIEKAACDDCRTRTNEAYENKALNCDLLVVPRKLLDLKRRRRGKNKKPLLFPPSFAAGTAHLTESGERINLLENEYPPVMVMIVLEPAGKLVGLERVTGSEQKIRIWMRSLAQRSHPAQTVRQRFAHFHFAMMLAKIGYSFAVAERGMGGFEGSEIRELLAGNRDDVYNFIGGSIGGERLTDRFLHHLALRERGEWLTAIVHLFASYQAPPYEVVVGRILES